tara:strand:- start:699 stop:878 length:180 start_codon:yes stop_codon:yes gene_type:complete
MLILFKILSRLFKWVIYKFWDFNWRMSDCEDLVRGLVTRNNGVKFIVGIAAYSIADCIS